MFIEMIYPQSGPGAELVKIIGKGFTDSIVVKFNNKSAKIKSVTEDLIITEVPKGAGSGNVSIELGEKKIEGPYFEYTPVNWTLEQEYASWLPRDSHVGLVYNNRLWVLGGWFSSFDTSFHDVWSSSDGKVWDLVNQSANWVHGDLPVSIVFKDKMWIMGGTNNGRLETSSQSNEIWSSKDGSNWTLENYAEWSPRFASEVIEFNGKLWLFGGQEALEKSPKNDIWFSEDGIHWKLGAEHAEWAPRSSHKAVVLNGKIYLFGGGVYTPEYNAYSDVWSSKDGIHWDLITEKAPWHERLWPSVVVYRNRMWIMGGWSGGPYQNWADVWYSINGKDWKQLKTRNIWKERHAAAANVFQDKIWITGGNTDPLVNDVWSLYIPNEDWFAN
ncbi:MAG: hypothetical protein QM768_11485 [Agriterribacter sp.]